VTAPAGVAPPTDPEQVRRLRDLLLRRQREGGLSRLSHGQQAMWFLHHVDPGNVAYNLALAFEVRSELDLSALRGAVADLERRHPILRTTYLEMNGVPLQRTHEGVGVGVEVVDARAASPDEFDAMLTAQAMRPFDLRTDRVLRITVYERPGGPVLLIVAHHIAIDGWSLYVCLEDLGALYTARVTGTPADLPTVDAQYFDYVAWQSNLLEGPAGDRLVEYWRERLSGDLTPLNLPTDRPRPRAQTYRGARVPFALDEELTAALAELAQRRGATLFAVLLAGLQAVLSRYTGQRRPRVAAMVAHRERAEFGRTVGYFADALVVRGDLSGEPGFAELVDRAGAEVLGALEHQDLPFAELVRASQVERDPGRAPLCDVGFVLQRSHRFAFVRDDTGGASPLGLRSSGESGLVLELGALRLSTFPVDHPVSRYDLELQMVQADTTLSAVLTYNSDLFDRQTAERMADHLVTFLRSAVADPHLPLSRHDLLPAPERRRLLRWGGLAPSTEENREDD
jgi:hypothetical protein